MASNIIPEFRLPSRIETKEQAQQAIDAIRSTFTQDQAYVMEFTARVGAAAEPIWDLIKGRCPEAGVLDVAVMRALNVGRNMAMERVESARRSHALRVMLRAWMTETGCDMLQAETGTAVLRDPIMEGGPRALAVIKRGKRKTVAAKRAAK